MNVQATFAVADTTSTLLPIVFSALPGMAIVFAVGHVQAGTLVPGVASVDLQARQLWWFATVGSAAVAMGLIAFGRSGLAWGAAVVLLLAPHVVGAPQPDAFAGPVPTEIGALFAARVLGVGFVAWVLTGLLVAYFRQHGDSRAGEAVQD